MLKISLPFILQSLSESVDLLSFVIPIAALEWNVRSQYSRDLSYNNNGIQYLHSLGTVDFASFWMQLVEHSSTVWKLLKFPPHPPYTNFLHSLPS